MDEGYRILEHPADMGIEATGPDLKSAFKQAALGLISIIVDPASVEPREQKAVTLHGTDAENLLVKWLSEILYLYDGEDFVTSTITIKKLAATELDAVLAGETVDGNKHRLKMDVKAITYHQLKVEERQNGCVVSVFLDI
ncbi:archease [bacterium]|nr:MAG: archease [bacterium]